MLGMTVLEALTKMDEDVLVIGIIMIMMVLIAVTAGVTATWYRCRKLQIEADLKMEMIERGMSADEISQVLNATLSESLIRSRRHHSAQ